MFNIWLDRLGGVKVFRCRVEDDSLPCEGVHYAVFSLWNGTTLNTDCVSGNDIDIGILVHRHLSTDMLTKIAMLTGAAAVLQGSRAT